MDIFATKPTIGKTLRTLNGIQLSRLQKIISNFKTRDKKLVYVGGQLHSDESAKVWLTFLNLANAAQGAKISRLAQKQALLGRKNIGNPNASDAVLSVDEHSALDLFETACKMVPGFEAASARRYKEKQRVYVARPANAPIPYDGSEPPLLFESPLLDRSEIKPSEIYNALAIGSTGSGKTASFVMPALMSMLDYRLEDGTTSSLLVVDPKVELLSGVKGRLGALGELDRLTVIGECDPINYFDEGDGLSVTDRFEKLKCFTTVTSTNSDDNRWQIFSEQLILSFLKDDQKYANATQIPLLESVAAIVTGEVEYLKRNQWVALRKLLVLGMEHSLNLRHISDAYDVLTLSVGMTKLDRPFSRYVGIKDPDQFFYNARGALVMVDVFGSEDLEPILDISVRRGLSRGDRTDVADLIERGAVIVFQPRQTATHDFMGRALKSQFFRCVMQRTNMLRPIGYFCDEFQRYITTDPETGEHAFLDRCRAFRANSFLATQSMAALLAATNRGPNAGSALDSILVNTPTKICFRTTDPSAVSTMKSFIPGDPRSDNHVLSFRPPSSLQTGEYYFAFQHTWGRTRYKLPAHPH